MVDKILTFKDSSDIKGIRELEKEVIASKDERLMFLYLYYVSDENLNSIGKEILKTGNYRYIHFLLRSFECNNYTLFLDFILLKNNDPGYLFNILYDVDYIDNDYRLKIINKIISLQNNVYITKASYYYFVILNLYDENLFNKIKLLYKEKFAMDFNKNNYKSNLENILNQENNQEDPDEFSPNCYKGRKNYIPNIIVCHINNTYSSAIKHFYNEKSEVSSHYLIRKDGHIKQIVSLDDTAWANGTSLNTNSDVYYKFASSKLINSVNDNANYFTFSIEHESFDGSLTDEQLKSTIKVMKEIIEYLKNKYNYDFQIDREHIIGHNEINPVVRKKCPGNKFPFDKIIESLK